MELETKIARIEKALKKVKIFGIVIIVFAGIVGGFMVGCMIAKVYFNPVIFGAIWLFLAIAWLNVKFVYDQILIALEYALKEKENDV